MARYTPQNFGGDLAPLNPEFEKIKQAIDDTLSRVGDTPNSVTATLDLNSNRIINLPAPESNTEPFRKLDLPDTIGKIEAKGDEILEQINVGVDQAEQFAIDAGNSATAASNSASAASTSASNASTSKSNALQYSQDALGYRDTTLTYRNEAEVFRNESQAAAQQSTNVLTTSATAATGSINEFQSSISVNLPLANSVPANTVCSFLVQEKYKAGAKTINVQGSNIVSDAAGTDTSIVLTDGFSGRVYLISDGVSDWRI